MQKIKNMASSEREDGMHLTDLDFVLLSHVDMCYSVALALTRDPDRGKELARATITWAWRHQEEMARLGEGGIKMFLLQDLRRRFRKACALAGSMNIHRSSRCAFTVVPQRSGQNAGQNGKSLCTAETAGAR